MKPHHNCPVQASINCISGKWKVQIIWHLSFGSLRFAQLHRQLKLISEKVLVDQLKELENDGVVSRLVTPSRPPRTDYSLTVAGDRLVPLLDQLCGWGSEQFGIKPSMPRRRE